MSERPITPAEQKVIDAACAWRKARARAIKEAVSWRVLANAESDLSAAVREYEQNLILAIPTLLARASSAITTAGSARTGRSPASSATRDNANIPMRGTTKPPSRPGTVILDTLPGKGPWQLLTCKSGRFGEIVVAVSPDQPVRAYKDGKMIDIWEGFDR